MNANVVDASLKSRLEILIMKCPQMHFGVTDIILYVVLNVIQKYKLIITMANNRAEEATLKAYPNDTYFGGRSAQRLFREGYEQAEKDLALTWEDIRSIIIINEKYTTMLLNSTPWDGIYTKTEYEEVLRRFNDQREKK